MRALSWLLYWLGDLVSRTLCRWGLAGSLYQKLMLLSVECDKDFNVWKEVKPRKKRRKRKGNIWVKLSLANHDLTEPST